MFEKFNEIWEKWGFEIVLGGCLLFILIFWLFRRGKMGTWASYYTYTRTPKKGRRPPQESKGEKECRRVLRELFNKPFNKDRPDFLRNPVTGNIHNLELDCFDAEMNLAVEYNGVQHYKYVPYMHRNKDAFLNQKYRDELKHRMCHDYGINLIEVPHTVKVPDIRNFLIKRLKVLQYL